MSLRIIFMGTAELACSSLDALAHSPEFNVVAVVTQPDKPKGRDLKLQAPPVKQTAEKLGLQVLQPIKARAETFVQTLRELEADLIVVVAYGQILPQAILNLPKYGALNVHTSLLPKYRGAAPIQWAILDGEPETGVTIMRMDAGLDTGDILTQAITPIEDSDDSQKLHDRLAILGATLLIETIPQWVNGKIVPKKQPEESSYARKIAKEDGQINWREPAKKLSNQVRALTPWPGAFTFQKVDDNKRLLKIWATEIAETHTHTEPGTVLQADKHGILVACGENSLRILTLQREGGRRLSAQEFLAGNAIRPNEKLG